MLVAVKRPKFLKSVLGDPLHMTLFTVTNGFVVAATSSADWWWGHQVLAIGVVAAIYFGAAAFIAEMQYKDELFRALPGQIRYFNVTKRIDVKESGLGDLTYEFIGSNLGETQLRSLYHDCEYDRENPIESPVKAFVDGRPTQVTIKSHSKLSGGQVIGHKSRVDFDFPRPIRKGFQFPRHSFCLEGLDYKKALAGTDYTSHKVEVITDSLRIEVSAPPSFRVTDVQEKVVDFHGREDPLETSRVRTECPPACFGDASELIWEVSKPRLTYVYRIFFSIQKRT